MGIKYISANALLNYFGNRIIFKWRLNGHLKIYLLDLEITLELLKRDIVRLITIFI